ncbi:MAG: tetratricopeptide repeat protein [Verrucomicrobia subdivision 3 bacterium]|nr:tetratricopeptide repeat protein [Limisphaerales bacterium]
MRRKLVICLLLSVMTAAVYWPVRQHAFIYYDDPQFITENEEVKAGLTTHGFRYAFTHPVVGNWHPVTTLSHMLDCQLYGVHPGRHHLTNVALHAANAVLLFLLLAQMTGALWRSAAVAAFFALHPLRVESVVWISERKDVLCALFGLLTLIGYARFAQWKIQKSKSKLKEGELGRGGQVWYVVTLVLYALGLMSKAMLVTWPFVMLLLDLWPLKRLELSTFRFRLSAFKGLALEKVPFLALSAVFCGITLLVQQGAGAVSGISKIGMADRLANAVMSYVRYLANTLWPAKLAVIYPHPAVYYATAERWSGWQIGLAALTLLAVSAACLRSLRSRPYLAVGWFWYLGTMLPVIGLVQVGEQAMADRYTYLPLIGPVISVVWGIADFSTRWSGRRPLLWGLAVGLLIVGSVATRQQVDYWSDTVRLFQRTLAVTSANPSAHFAVGVGLEKTGEIEAAIRQYRAAIAIDSGYPKAHYNLGQLFRKQERWPEAALHYRAALAANPADVYSHLNLATVLQALNQTRAAVLEFEAALRLDPDSIEALNNLAWILATSSEDELRDGPQAVVFGEKACALSNGSLPTAVGTLAAAYAEAGRYADAVKTGERARDLAAAAGQAALAQRNEELLKRYRAQQPYRERKAIEVGR